MTPPRSLTAARAQIVHRHLAAHGPASPEDLAGELAWRADVVDAAVDELIRSDRAAIIDLGDWLEVEPLPDDDLEAAAA